MRTKSIAHELNTIEDHEDRLLFLCGEIAYRPVDSPIARRVMGLADWSQYYPGADRINGHFTGELIAIDDDRFANVNDWYVVPMSSLTSAQRQNVRENGYPGS